MSLLSYQPCEHDALCETGTRPTFFTLAGTELEHLDNIAHDVSHPAGSVIFREGDPAGGIYLLCSGQVKLTTQSDDHHRMILKVAKPGDVLGLSAMLNGLPYEISAETLVPSTFKRVGQQAFMNFIRNSAEAGYTTAVELAKEHREVFLGVRRLSLSSSASSRVAHILIEFLRSGNPQGGIASFPLALTHAELASMAGTSRETVTRLLNQFERNGIISRSNSIITVVQLKRLEQLAN